MFGERTLGAIESGKLVTAQDAAIHALEFWGFLGFMGIMFLIMMYYMFIKDMPEDYKPFESEEENRKFYQEVKIIKERIRHSND